MALRLLHLDSGREWRGGQRQVFLLARAQRDRGHEPLVVAHPEAPLQQRLRAAGIATSIVRMRADWDLQAARRVRALIRTWRPDVVHAHDARSHAIALAALIGRASVPLVVTRRVAFVPKGRLKYGKRVARFVAISEAVRCALIQGGVEPERIQVVHSGVPTPPSAPPRDWRTERGWPRECVVCGVVGAMTAEKGVQVLAAVAARLTPQQRGRTRLVLMGGRSGGTEDVGGIETLRAGFVEEIHPAMAGLDMLWHPSLAEGLGTAVIDAMALRVPPVTFAVGGLPELVIDGQTGLLAPAGDADAFAACVARLLDDATLRARLADAGVARAAEFSVERMVAGTEATYQALLAATR